MSAGNGYEGVVPVAVSTETRLLNLLWTAIRTDSTLIVENLVTEPALNPNLCYSAAMDQTPLLYACVHRKIPLVKALLKCAALDPQLGKSDGWSPLRFVCRQNDLEILELLLADPRIDVNYCKEGTSPLYSAAAAGLPEVVERLLRVPGIDVNLADENGATPFFMACQCGRSAVARLLLLDPRIDPNRAMHDQQTPLSVLLEMNEVLTMKLLLALADDLRTETLIDVEQGHRMGLPADYLSVLKVLGKPFVLPRELGEAKGNVETVALFDEFVQDRRSTRSRLWFELDLHSLCPPPSSSSRPSFYLLMIIITIFQFSFSYIFSHQP